MDWLREVAGFGTDVVALAVLAVVLLKKPSGSTRSEEYKLLSQQTLDVIKENSEINSRLVTQIEHLTQISADLTLAVRELLVEIRAERRESA